jgi:antitoxin VapB
MNAQRSTKVFKSGNSKAVRLPADYPLELGQEVIVREECGVYVIEPVHAKSDLASLFGSIPGLKPLTREDREFEHRELDWDMKRLKRD